MILIRFKVVGFLILPNYVFENHDLVAALEEFFPIKINILLQLNTYEDIFKHKKCSR